MDENGTRLGCLFLLRGEYMGIITILLLCWLFRAIAFFSTTKGGHSRGATRIVIPENPQAARFSSKDVEKRGLVMVAGPFFVTRLGQ